MRIPWLVLVAALATSGAAAALDVEVAVGKDDAEAGVAYLRYYPETVVVYAGENVTWRAASQTPHTVTQLPPGPGAFDSTPAMRPGDPALAAWFGPGGFMLAGQSFNHTFHQAGNFSYACKIHPGMVGTVHVINATQGGSALPLPGQPNASRPSDVYVDAGWGSGDTTVDLFGPKVITVPVGTTVVWTNKHSAEPHTVTGQGFDSSPNVGPPPSWWSGPQGIMGEGGQNSVFRHTFATPGAFAYFCKLHPGMHGTVLVLPKPAAGNGTAGLRAGDTGSRVPGLEMPVVLGALGAVALAHRRLRG